ncbi:peptidoglycan D,D-transpeptidase FtsI family protein [Bailinhaonella thermotolerans]|uniref:peptidoglycan D,D-transpeptidase FtsI family protein n=1 Tax=Bailinhaonella thermotolerans TaxID=1070861 RepID=UPI001F5B38E0|nr:penicillin-binding protein 2 [Bailinhaonella thermotolerans]
MLRLGSSHRRINAGMLAMAFVLSLFAGRLVQLQGLDSKVYADRAERQRNTEAVVPARRGTISDAGGNVLAMTADARTIFVDPTMVSADKRQAVAALLSRALNIPPGPILEKLGRTESQYQVVARNVEPGVASALISRKIRGVGSEPTYRRVYPDGKLAADLIGYVGQDGTGLGGIEAAWNSTLRGQDGRQSVEQGQKGHRIPMTRSSQQAAVPGTEVRLTVDRDIQWEAQRAISEQVAKTQARSGTVIVMDVRTGHVLALANAPGLDLEHWEKAPAESLSNRALAEVFEPGSTNKVITAAAAMETAGVRPETTFVVPDRYKCADRVLRDSHPHPVQHLTFAGVLATSSNVGTLQAAERVGKQGLYDFMRKFGFGRKTGLGFPGEAAGLLPKPETWSGSQVCTVAFGQGVSVTAMQMASVYQTIANRGVRVEPQLVAGTVDGRKRFTPAPAAERHRVISERTAREIARMLEGVTDSSEGTGAAARIPGYRIAGKTGTAQRYDSDRGGYHGYTASFAGFTPADDPRLVTLVVLQDPKKGYYGGDVAAPVFRDVTSFALKTRKIPPTGTAAPPLRIHAAR